MNLLLDTHMALWAITDGPTLPPAPRALIMMTEAAAMPPLKQVDVLACDQTTLNRQLSQSIGELLLLKTRKVPSIDSRYSQHASRKTIRFKLYK